MSLSGFNSPATSKRSNRKTLLRLAAIIVVVVIGILVGLSVIGFVTRSTEGDVRSLIAEHLAKGATIDDVYAFLDSRHIRHDLATTDPAISDSTLTDVGYSGNVHFVFATMHTTAYWFIGTSDFLIYFILDGDDRLEDYIVQRYETYP